ncbi:DUF4179 domain-containing protein [Paenibacillus paeoniae]|uniref:DUF4179 domain-containing protein n=1 Tax=Paenibacillus paeoniae TaxID=2292705 RepID=A0A371P7L9_9BACL|nr:DUF4179 domain-containing protein [Paenibacillus paeoniae]REK71944.1 DUF4179 domain-containing protein [Paenibacillus paeoniae]
MIFWERTATKKASRNEDSQPMENRGWEKAIFAQKLPDEFTNKVMLALEEVEIEPAQSISAPSKSSVRIEANDTSIAAQIQRSRMAKRAWRLKVLGASAAAILLAGSTLLYTQPTLAEMVRSLFAKDAYVDQGMQQAQQSGFVQISGASAVDQGYVLKVNEVIADSTRLIIGIDVYDAKGNVQNGEIDHATADFNLFSIEKGNVRDVSYERRTGGNQTTNRIEFDFMRPVLSNKLQLNVQIKNLRLYGDKLNEDASAITIKGDWSLVVGADLAKAKEHTLLTPIHQLYETPSGIQIHMQGASRTPSGGSLEFTTKLTSEAAGRAVDGQSGFHKLKFHLEDEQGSWLGGNDEFEIGRRSELERWSGVTQWFYHFNHFAYDKEKIRFVLDSYVIRERSEESVTFDPAVTSAEHPAIFEGSGDKLLLEGLRIGPDPNNPKSDQILALIPFGGTITNNIAEDTWKAVDENGKEYSIHVGGGIATDRYGAHSLGDVRFVVDGLKQMPKQLTLKRTIVSRQYMDADWSFDIPQTGTKGVIPE